MLRVAGGMESHLGVSLAASRLSRRWHGTFAEIYESAIIGSRLKPKVYISASQDDWQIASELGDRLSDLADVILARDIDYDVGSPLQQLLQVADDIDVALFFLPSGRVRPSQSSVYFEAGLVASKIGLPRTLFLTTDGPAAVRHVPGILRGIDFVWAEKSQFRALSHLVRDFVRSSRQRRHPADARVVARSSSTQGTARRPGKSASPASRSGAFVSYAHADQRWLKSLQIALSPLVRHENISIWDDTKIKPGTKWKHEITKAISSAQVAILLVSPNFLASPFIADHELPPLLKAAEKNGLKILWVLVSACNYKKTPIADYQAAHNISKPLDALQPSKRNVAWVQITDAIDEALGGNSKAGA